MDLKTPFVLLLLDLNAAFDTFCVLLDWLENEFTVSGLAHVWLKYYIHTEHIVFPVVKRHQIFTSGLCSWPSAFLS